MKQSQIVKVEQKKDGMLTNKSEKTICFKGAGRREIYLQELEECGKETNIPGLRCMLANKTGRFGRALWILGFMLSIGLLIYSCKQLAERFTHTEFKTTIYSTNYPIYKVPFPEVTICNKNRLNWQRLELAKRKYLWPIHHNTSYEQLFDEIIALYDTFVFGTFDRFAKLDSRRIAELNYINFTEVARHMVWSCEELLTDCMWRGRPMNCCDIFIRRRSSLGICMAFNSVESTAGRLKQKMDSKWPWRVSMGGPEKGLQVRVLLNEKKHSPYADNSKGIMLMTVQPKVWSYTPIEIPANAQVRIYLDAFMSFYDPRTRRVSSKERRCVFLDEENSPHFKTLLNHVYMFENCHAECMQEYLVRYCNCTIDIFFPVGNYPICQVVDMPCLARHNHLLHYFEYPKKSAFTTSTPGMDCNCLLNCRSWRYVVKARSRALLKSERWITNDTVLLDINFGEDTIIVYKTDLVYTWLDFLYSFGSITVLFLGCSIISLLELIYVIFVQMLQRKLRKSISADKFGIITSHKRPPLRSYRLRSENNLNIYRNVYMKKSVECVDIDLNEKRV